MAHVNFYSNATNIVDDIATQLTTGDTVDLTNNWTEVHSEVDVATGKKIKAVFKVEPERKRQWVKKKKVTISGGAIDLSPDVIVPGSNPRVYLMGKRVFLYQLPDSAATLSPYEFKIDGASSLVVDAGVTGDVLVDYEKVVSVKDKFYVEINKPEFLEDGVTPNYYHIQWCVGDDYDETGHAWETDHSSEMSKINWMTETQEAIALGKPWVTIEGWISFDKNAATGVLMGDPGYATTEWLSTPFGWGSLKQIDGALETDNRGNFGGFGGSCKPPVISRKYGDFTGTGITDVIMVASKSGRPFQAHKVAVFGGYEFREKTFNGQSAHTGKHAVSEIVLIDAHENDRGYLQHCLAVPRVAKEHGTELIYKRYISGEEERYIFLNVKCPYTIFNTSPDVLLSIALRTDI